jgi:hypothetical protein
MLVRVLVAYIASINLDMLSYFHREIFTEIAFPSESRVSLLIVYYVVCRQPGGRNITKRRVSVGKCQMLT